MKKTLLTVLVAAGFAASPDAQSQSIDYGMVAGFVQSPASSDVVGGGFQLLGVTPSSGFNPVGAGLADLLNSANMLSVSNSFTSIDVANPGQFYVGGLSTLWSTGATIANGTQLYLLASTSASFDLSSPWALVTGSDVGWFSPNPTDPLGASVIELSLVGNSIIAAGNGGPGVGAYFGSTPGTTTSAGDANLTLVPEPSTYALLALSGLALGGYVMRRRRRA